MRLDLNNLQPGEEISSIFALRGKKLLPYRSGAGHFLALTLGDKTGQMEGRVWEQAVEINNLCRVGGVIKITGQVVVYNGSTQLNISAVEKCDGAEIQAEDFIPSHSFSPGEVRETWLNITDSLDDPYLRQLLAMMAENHLFISGLAECPAAKRNHHAIMGGLWEHSLGMARAAEGMSSVYPQVRRDLLVAGALLHDIGKLEEFQCRADIEYTDAGRLMGHIVLGIGMVDRCIDRILDFPETLRLKLLHMIASHHGQYEWQSPKRPKFMEAAILHQLDMIDSQVAMFTEAVDGRETVEDSWTGWVRGLDRYVYCD